MARRDVVRLFYMKNDFNDNETEYLASVAGESIVIPTPNDFAAVDLRLFVSRLN